MTSSQSAAANSSSATAIQRPTTSASKPWLLGAFLLAGAAQLITISALLSVDPLAPTWAALLLAVAPGPLAALTAFAPPAVARPAAVAAAVAMVVGIVGEIGHTGPLFIPALVAVVVGGMRLWLADPRRA